MYYQVKLVSSQKELYNSTYTRFNFELACNGYNTLFIWMSTLTNKNSNKNISILNSNNKAIKVFERESMQTDLSLFSHQTSRWPTSSHLRFVHYIPSLIAWKTITRFAHFSPMGCLTHVNKFLYKQQQQRYFALFSRIEKQKS